MKHKTLWRPDTCGCEIEFEWDDSDPAEARAHGVSRVLKRCAAHGGHNDESCFNVVLEENRRKNRSLGLTKEKLGLSEDQARKIGWSFDGDRVLHLDLGAEVAAGAGNSHQDELDAVLGQGKVKVH